MADGSSLADGSLWQLASAFAAHAHRHQVRRDGRTPYFSHPVRVALTVAVRFGCSDQRVLAAALLHDVLEDTTADYDDLLARFGPEVASIVAALSKDKRLVEPQREEAYDRQLRQAPWQARLIKLADVYDNLSDAADDVSRRSFIDRAGRALAIAGDDPQLQEGIKILRELVRETESGMEQSGA